MRINIIPEYIYLNTKTRNRNTQRLITDGVLDRTTDTCSKTNYYTGAIIIHFEFI